MPDEPNRPPITPDLKIGELLEAYPELEEVLIEAAPAFKKLRNPVLRRTIAKITSIRQAAQVGGVSLGEIIGRLRAAAGIEEELVERSAEPLSPGDRPEWVDAVEPAEVFDAVETVESGGHPLPQVMSALEGLEPGEVYAIVTPFVPAPMIDVVREKGYSTWTERLAPERFKSYFMRPRG